MLKTSNISDIVERLKRLGDEYPRVFIRLATEEAYERSVSGARKHSKTGRMEGNIELEVRGLEGKVWIGNSGMITPFRGGTNYGVFVHFGTRPHDIRPRERKALRWTRGSVFAFAKTVHHPGYKGDPFMYRALDETERIFDKLATEAVNEAIH